MKTIKEIENEFFESKMEYMELFEEGDIEGALNLLKEVWNSFPEPKIEDDLFYLVVEDFITICIESKRLEMANKYISLLFVSGLKRADYGTKEFIAGRLAYEQGEFELAKQLFYISNIKCKGDLFKGKENKKYKDLLAKL